VSQGVPLVAAAASPVSSAAAGCPANSASAGAGPEMGI